MKTRIRDSYTPKLGDYCNTFVIDKETGNQYLFDADGVWTLISTDEEGIVAEAVAQANAYTDDVAEGKVDKEEGKGLSENDFTDEDKEKLDDIEEGAQENVIEVVKRNGTALPITDKTVDIAVPTTTSSLTNDSGYITNGVDDLVNYYDKDETDTLIATEAGTRDAADLNLQEQIDAISSASDVVDVVGTYAELQDYDTSRLGNNDIIKVLTDETHDNAISYYRWNDTTETFTYIGSQGLSYTKSETDATFVPQTRTINGKGLNSDVVLTAADVNALPASTVIPTVNDATLTIKKNGTTVTTFTANSAQNVTADISVPTKVSDLTNDLDFVEEADLADVAFSGAYADLTGTPSVPTKTSDLTNDSDFVSDANYVHTDNNFTTTLKNKLDGIAAGAEVNVQSDWNTTDTTSDAFIKNKPSIPTKTSDLTNDSGFITSAAVPTKTSDLTNDSGFITKNVSDLTNYYTQSEVNGMFNALSIPTKTSDLVNDSGFLTSIPIASASTLGGVKIGSGINVAADGTISAAVASLDWANITNKPTNVSYWTNDAGYITSAALPTKTSDLTNDSGFITSADVPTKTSDLTNDSGFITSSVNNLTNYYKKSETYTQGEVNSLLSAIVIPTKTSELTNDSNFITSADLPTIDSTLSTSSTNAVENQAIANAIDLKYDKTGGEITGNAKVDGTFTLDIEDEDYDAGINFTRTLDNNLGTTLTLTGYAGNTNYKTLLRNIATPNSDYDAANKKYVDDHILTPVNYLVALDQNGAIDLVSSSLNYATVKAYLTNNTKDVYLDVLWEPSRFYAKAVQDEDTNNGPVNFIGSYSRGGKMFTALFMLDSSDNLSVLHLEPQLTYEKAQAINSTNISSTTEYPTTKAVADYVAAELAPTVIYSDATGLSPLQADVSASIAYQLTGLDLSPYKRIKVHIGSDGSSGTGFKSSGMIELSLDANLANPSTGQWVGSVITENAADRNRLSAFLVAVSPDKTSFAYARATSLYGTGATNISDAYVKLIEGFKY